MARFWRYMASAAFVVGLAGCAALIAQVISVPKKTFEPSAIPSGVYRLDRDHANLLFEIDHMGFSTYVGRFNRFDAEITYDQAHPEAARLSAGLEAASIDSNMPVLDKKLRGSEFLDADKFPAIEFTADSIAITGQNTGRITGVLSMHGARKPVILDVKFNGGAVDPLTGGYTLGFAATGHLKRSDFGVAAYVPLISDEVTFRINAEFIRKAS